MHATILNPPERYLSEADAKSLAAHLDRESKAHGDTWHYFATPAGPVHTCKYWQIQIWDADEYVGTL